MFIYKYKNIYNNSFNITLRKSIKAQKNYLYINIYEGARFATKKHDRESPQHGCFWNSKETRKIRQGTMKSDIQGTEHPLPSLLRTAPDAVAHASLFSGPHVDSGSRRR